MNLEVFQQHIQNELKEKGRVYLRVKVIPGAPQNKIIQILETEKEQTVKIAIVQKAEKGKANAALCRFLEKNFGCSCVIITGASDRVKMVCLQILDKMFK